MLATTNQDINTRAAATIQNIERQPQRTTGNRNPNVASSASGPSNPVSQGRLVSVVQVHNLDPSLRDVAIRNGLTALLALGEVSLAIASARTADGGGECSREVMVTHFPSIAISTTFALGCLFFILDNRSRDSRNLDILNKMGYGARALSVLRCLDTLWANKGPSAIPYQPWLLGASSVGIEVMQRAISSGLGSISAHVSRPTRSALVVPVVDDGGHRSRVTASSTGQNPGDGSRPSGDVEMAEIS